MIYQNLIRKTQPSDLPAPVLANKQTSLYQRRKAETAQDDSRRVYVLQKLQLNGAKGPTIQDQQTPRITDINASLGSVSNYNNSHSLLPHPTDRTGGSPGPTNESQSASSEESKRPIADELIQGMPDLNTQNTL